MKVIAFDRRPDGVFVEPPAVELIADSAVVLPPHPLFLPDFDANWEARIYPAYRIGRLGKSIARKFASRYIDAYTLALRLVPVDTNRELQAAGLPCGLDGLFDSALTLGRWTEIDHALPETFEITSGALNVEIDNHFDAACRALESISRYATVKTGDVICPSWIPTDVVPEVGSGIEAAINGATCLSVRIR